MIEKTKYISDGKQELKHLEINEYSRASKLYFPVTNPRCSSATIIINEGDDVEVGQILGLRNGGYFEQPIHSSVSGKYIGKEKHFDLSGRMIEYLVIENDFKERTHETIIERSEEEINKLSQNDYIEIMKNNGLVGLGGSAFPTYIKFKTDETIHTIVANGIECEPYLVSDYHLMLEKSMEIIQGLVYAMNAVKASKGVIALKKKYVEIAELFNKNIKEYFSDYEIKVAEIGNYYPQGWELEVIKNALNIEVPQGELTAKYGVLNMNTSTLYSLFNAVKYNKPILDRIFVLSGDGINNKAYKAKVGTLVSELVLDAGGYSDDKNKVLIIGGPMMGTSVNNDDIAIVPTITSLIVQNEQNVKEYPCMRCASCVYSCPAKLQPVTIMNAYDRKDKEALKELGLNKCIECGLCSYTCPSKIHLTEIMRLAKKMIK